MKIVKKRIALSATGFRLVVVADFSTKLPESSKLEFKLKDLSLQFTRHCAKRL